MGFGEVKRAYRDGGREEVLAAYAADPHEMKSNGETLLHYACSYADADAVEYLLGVGLASNAKGSLDRTPLHYLAEQENIRSPFGTDTKTRKCAELLLKAGASVMRKDADGFTTLMTAAKQGRPGLVETIAKSGGRLTFTDSHGDNALHLACKYVRHWIGGLSSNNSDTKAEAEQIVENYFLCVKSLVDAGIDAEEKDEDGKTPLDIAVSSGAKKIAALLNGTLGEDGNVPADGGMTIYQAVEKGDCAAISALAESGCELDKTLDEGPFKGMTPLGIACETMQLDMVKCLLKLGADPNYKNADGKTAVATLFEFYGGRHFTRDTNVPVAIFRTLVEYGMDKDGSINDKSDTPLRGACQKMAWGGGDIYLAVGEALIQMDADPNRSNLDGVTPLMTVCESRQSLEDFPLVLLEAGAELCTVDKLGNTPLHYAAKNQSSKVGLEMAQLLFDFGLTSVDAVNNDGKTALELAADGNNESLVKLILMQP